MQLLNPCNKVPNTLLAHTSSSQQAGRLWAKKLITKFDAQSLPKVLINSFSFCALFLPLNVAKVDPSIVYDKGRSKLKDKGASQSC